MPYFFICKIGIMVKYLPQDGIVKVNKIKPVRKCLIHRNYSINLSYFESCVFPRSMGNVKFSSYNEYTLVSLLLTDNSMAFGKK